MAGSAMLGEDLHADVRGPLGGHAGQILADNLVTIGVRSDRQETLGSLADYLVFVLQQLLAANDVDLRRQDLLAFQSIDKGARPFGAAENDADDLHAQSGAVALPRL